MKDAVPSANVKEDDCLRQKDLAPWFKEVRAISNPVIAAYLQSLLLTGARRNELAGLLWKDVDFQRKSMTMRDKVKGKRTIPLTPHVESLIAPLPRRNDFVFSSPSSKSGRLEEPRSQHHKALAIAALPSISLHGLRRSFATLSEWVDAPSRVVMQIMGHTPKDVAGKHYIRRELDLLAMWHAKIEEWVLKKGEITFVPVQVGLRAVA